ncbi:MAG: GNAT family N-acetyltransferase [Bacteroidales bacterium]|nr:GNAT family N-acetyltransferase [Bacteroidales bacterium]
MSSLVIEKYGIILRTVEEDDAEFIVRLRTSERLGRYISMTSSDIEKQKDWIREYLVREKEGREYYFLCVDRNGNRFGTYRIYNIQRDSFVCGSWVFDESAPKDYAIKTEILAKEFAFEKTDADYFYGENRKDNKKVNRYNLSYHPELTGFDDLNYYYKFTRVNFEKTSTKLLALLTSR